MCLSLSESGENDRSDLFFFFDFHSFLSDRFRFLLIGTFLVRSLSEDDSLISHFYFFRSSFSLFDTLDFLDRGSSSEISEPELIDSLFFQDILAFFFDSLSDSELEKSQAFFFFLRSFFLLFLLESDSLELKGYGYQVDIIPLSFFFLGFGSSSLFFHFLDGRFEDADLESELELEFLLLVVFFFHLGSSGSKSEFEGILLEVPFFFVLT